MWCSPPAWTSQKSQTHLSARRRVISDGPARRVDSVRRTSAPRPRCPCRPGPGAPGDGGFVGVPPRLALQRSLEQRRDELALEDAVDDDHRRRSEERRVGKEGKTWW